MRDPLMLERPQSAWRRLWNNPVCRHFWRQRSDASH